MQIGAEITKVIGSDSICKHFFTLCSSIFGLRRQLKTFLYNLAFDPF